MKPFFIILGLMAFYSLPIQAQTVNNTNYYNFQKDEGSINWLRAADATPVIIDELLKNGIEYHTIGIGGLVRVNDSTRFVVTVTFDKGDNSYGFIYESGHGIPLNVTDRNFMKNPENEGYTQKEGDTAGKDIRFMNTQQLPSNIFLLRETCYWYQFDANNTKYPVNKETAQSILRQDIRAYLKRL